MEMFDKTRNEVRWLPHIRSFEIATAVIAVVAVMAVAWFLFASQAPLPVIAIAVLAFVTCIATIMRLLFDPDSVRARQTDLMLRISNAMVDLMAEGMTVEVAQRICEMLLPRTAAIAVAITDDTTILGYAGYKEMENPQGSAIRTQATHDTLEDGITRLLYTPAEIGFPDGSKLIKAAIIVPIEYGGNIVGTLKFYYRSGRRITETQKSIARGLGKLLSTEVAASKLEEQRELATSMELKMLQSQINPHFLFNTINTIASLIRTDPPKARELLREFAVFYRSTIEHSQDQIRLALELEQTLRYFSFEVARFGEDRLEMNVDLESKIENTSFNVAEMMVPPFLLQPIVENAVKHAMPAEGKLTIVISAQTEGSDVLISVTDDGVGMDRRACNNMMHSESSTGLGIAMKNVHDRMHGFFGSDADILVATKPGEGTQVTLRFPKVLETQG